MVDGEGLHALIEEAVGLGNPAERRSVEAGLRNLDAWRNATAGQVLSVPPALYVSPAEEFRVSFIPDFGYRMSAQTVAVHIWNTSTVELSARMTYAALANMASAYDGPHVPDDLAVLSLPDNRLYRLSDVDADTRLGALVAGNLDQLFASVREDLGGPGAPAEIRPRGSHGGP